MKLPKGDFTIRFQLRHDRSDLIEKLKDMVLLIEKKLEKPINLSIFNDLNGTLTDGPKYGTKKISLGKNSVFFVKRPDDDSHPKDAKPGDILSGVLNIFKENKDDKDKKIKGYKFTCVVPPPKPIQV